MKNFLTAHWENLIMANYIIDPDVLLPYLPKGTELDFYENKTYVSLVGFMFKKTKIFGIPIPVFGSFEEVNLRFYVIRKENDALKRGVVFINETVPNKFVAWVANHLYKEHYTAIPTKHKWILERNKKHIEYHWKVNQKWNSLSVEASMVKKPMAKNSIEEFIFEHYYGYTRINSSITEEYKIDHPSWEINEILDYNINCDFKEVYGKDFEFLKYQAPASVMIAEGSQIAVKWKRNKIQF